MRYGWKCDSRQGFEFFEQVLDAVWIYSQKEVLFHRYGSTEGNLTRLQPAA